MTAIVINQYFAIIIVILLLDSKSFIIVIISIIFVIIVNTDNPICIFYVNIQLTKFYSYVHSVLIQCEYTNKLVLLEMLKTNCASILFYGIDAISINSNIKQGYYSSMELGCKINCWFKKA